MGLGAVGLIGTGLQLYGGIREGLANKAAADSAANMQKYNAQIELRRKHMIEQRGKRASILQAESASRKKSSLTANLGASGAVLQTGIPLDILGAQAVESEKENLGIGYDTQVAASQAESQAGMHELQADIYTKKGKNLMYGQFINTGTSLLSGFGK